MLAQEWVFWNMLAQFNWFQSKEHVSKQQALSFSHKHGCFVMVRNSGFQTEMVQHEMNSMTWRRNTSSETVNQKKPGIQGEITVVSLILPITIQNLKPGSEGRRYLGGGGGGDKIGKGEARKWNLSL